MQGLAAQKQVHDKAIVGLGSGIHSIYTQATEKHKKSSMNVVKFGSQARSDEPQPESEELLDESEKEMKLLLAKLPDRYKFSTMNKKIEKRLLEKPLTIPGCGLP